jgi:hypothetical protein
MTRDLEDATVSDDATQKNARRKQGTTNANGHFLPASSGGIMDHGMTARKEKKARKLARRRFLKIVRVLGVSCSSHHFRHCPSVSRSRAKARLIF